jgi:hypothetical protein
MATKMGYAPGVRIQLKDNSAYTVVQNPNTVAGIVGYASKGELNKIINVANTGELGVKLGYGYQSYKYNQGMYAANAVLTTGGEVEFVRPYGEEISRTDAYKRDLKTDAFVVAFDKNAALYDDNKRPYESTSLNVKHFASTRYKTDGAAEFGVTRKINNIAETIESNNNVQFNVDASENFADSAASRKYFVSDDGKDARCTDMVMFAIMNRDPSYANRAYDRYEVIHTDKTDTAAGTIQCTLSTKPVFVVGDTVYVPDTSKKQNQYGNGGSSAKTATALVTAIEDKVVTLKFDEGYVLGINKPDVLIFNDPENAIADGFDYLNIKTAVAGNSIKNFAAIKFGVEDKFPSEVLKTGALLVFRDKNNTEFYVRLNGGNTPFASGTATPGPEDNQLTVKFDDTSFIPSNYVIEGETLEFNLVPKTTPPTTGVTYYPFVVQKIDGNKLIGVKPSGLPEAGEYTFTDGVFSEQLEDIVVADVTAIMSDAESDNWYYVAQQIANALQRYKGYSRVAFTNDIISVSDNKVIVDPSAAYDYAVGDIVAILRNSNTVANAAKANVKAYDKETYVITGINPMSGVITLDAVVSTEIVDGISYQLINLTSTNATVYNADTTYKKLMTRTATYSNVKVFTETITVESTTTYKSKIAASDVEHAIVGTEISLTKGSTKLTFTVAEIGTDGYLYTEEKSTIPVAADTYTSATFTYQSLDTFDFADMYLASSYTLYVSKLDQGIATFGELSTDETINTKFDFVVKANSVFNATVDKSPTVLADSDIGASFLALGLAKTRYVDVDFDGNPKQVFTLTDEGVAVARMFMAVRYRFNGKLYEFEGTVAPFKYNNRQLSIKEAADYELENSGLEFVLNDSGVLDYFLENNSYDLSQTIIDGVLNGSYTAIAYDEDDPAIQYDAVWTYDPLNNNSGSTLATVWNLFVNKDASDVDMLVAAGMAINAPFTRKNETLNTQVMQAMINVCEARKDCFCVFDGVYEPDIQKAVKKMISAGQLSLGRWGAIYDGRGVFQDSLYTNSQVDVMKSVQLAAIITANRSSGIFWIPPAGDEAYVPAAWGTKERFTRSYNSEDKNCDHAKLSDIHVNATRVNKDGIRIWGDFTCQMEDTAFNQIHVTMLVAGIHKMFYKYLDHKVFKLNTTVLRAQITSDLQDKLNAIKRQNPPGLIEGKVICDDTNNTPEIINQNFLIVDLRLLPPKSTRWIILRTTVESQKNGKTISTEVSEQ